MSIAFIRPKKKDEQKRINGGQTQKNITTAPYDDGYLWRKYGEKKIRGNAFPRSYYRCTYREDQGCQATKQVQQQCCSDPPLFLVTQKGEHTCNTAPATTPAGYGYMVQCHYQELPPHLQSTSSNLLPALSSMPDQYCGDCTLNHPAFSYSSRPTNQFFYDYQPCSGTEEEQYENHSVLDNSALSTPEAYAASMVCSDSNFSDDSFHENFSSSDMKQLEEFDFDEFCEFLVW